jgi:large subunit ribosomal protein L29
MAETDLQTLSIAELHTRINDARHALMNLRFQKASGELTDTSQLRIARRQIARLLTILHERERQAKEVEHE